MRYLKNLGRTLLYMLVIVLVFTLIVTLFSYFNIFGDNITKIMKFIIPTISTFIGGIMMGKRANKKGIIEGVRLSFILIALLMLLSVILSSFKPQSIIYYLIIMVTTIFGSLIGVQKKVQN